MITVKSTTTKPKKTVKAEGNGQGRKQDCKTSEAIDLGTPSGVDTAANGRQGDMSLRSAFPVTGETLLRFESSLRRQRSELTRAIGRAHEEIRALADCGPGDVIDNSWGSSKEAVFASYSMHRTRLRRVEVALERIATGEFGICAVCGGAIGLKRLKALPWANSCIDCQEQSEQGRVQCDLSPRTAEPPVSTSIC